MGEPYTVANFIYILRQHLTFKIIIPIIKSFTNLFKKKKNQTVQNTINEP